MNKARPTQQALSTAGPSIQIRLPLRKQRFVGLWDRGVDPPEARPRLDENRAQRCSCVPAEAVLNPCCRRISLETGQLEELKIVGRAFAPTVFLPRVLDHFRARALVEVVCRPPLAVREVVI